MPNYFEASDVLLISLVDAPIYEIMIPSKFQTYLQYSKPIFAVMKGEVPELIREYGLGLSADSDDIHMISNRFIDMMSLSANELKEMSLSAKSLLANFFEKDRNLSKLSSITLENAKANPNIGS
jgi:hypothetical protein